MTARRRQIRDLGDLRQMASVRLTELDMRQAKLQDRLRRLDVTRKACHDTLSASYDGWRRAISGRSFDPATMSFWSAEIVRAEAESTEIEAQIDATRQAGIDIQGQRAVASARHDAVTERLGAARRKARLRRDEAALEAHGGLVLTGWGRI